MASRRLASRCSARPRRTEEPGASPGVRDRRRARPPRRRPGRRRRRDRSSRETRSGSGSPCRDGDRARQSSAAPRGGALETCRDGLADTDEVAPIKDQQADAGDAQVTPEDDVQREQPRDGLDLDLVADGLEDVRARQADHPADDGGDDQRDQRADASARGQPRRRCRCETLFLQGAGTCTRRRADHRHIEHEHVPLIRARPRMSSTATGTYQRGGGGRRSARSAGREPMQPSGRAS